MGRQSGSAEIKPKHYYVDEAGDSAPPRLDAALAAGRRAVAILAGALRNRIDNV